MSAAGFTPANAERLTELLGLCKLPTMAAETVRRMEQEEQHDALGVLLDVTELEAADRHERRIDRLRRTSKLPPAKTLESFDLERLPLHTATGIVLPTGEADTSIYDVDVISSTPVILTAFCAPLARAV